jgi:hypothetical protein
MTARSVMVSMGRYVLGLGASVVVAVEGFQSSCPCPSVEPSAFRVRPGARRELSLIFRTEDASLRGQSLSGAPRWIPGAHPTWHLREAHGHAA